MDKVGNTMILSKSGTYLLHFNPYGKTGIPISIIAEAEHYENQMAGLSEPIKSQNPNAIKR